MQDQVAGLKSKSEVVNESLWPGIVDKIIPKNIIADMASANMLAIIFVAMLFGLALLSNDVLPKQKILLFIRIKALYSI